MKQLFHEINIKTHGQKLYNFTDEVENWITSQNFKIGIISINILHTSASLIIQENADPDVQKDIINYFNQLVPMNRSYIHNTEGKDDMPAHIKSILTTTNLSLSIKNKKLVLGTWQGLYLFEHRLNNQLRKINLHYIGE
tara:strand:- start:2746 stop:3162 length:417 start_codon:yes stop_codon:yes gene_type:complete